MTAALAPSPGRAISLCPSCNGFPTHKPDCSLVHPDAETERRIRIARGHRDAIWANLKNEDERLDQLVECCTRQCGGDRVEGKRLASLALWSVGP